MLGVLDVDFCSIMYQNGKLAVCTSVGGCAVTPSSIHRFFGVLLRLLQYTYSDDFAVKPLLLNSGIQKISILSVWAVACDAQR